MSPFVSSFGDVRFVCCTRNLSHDLLSGFRCKILQKLNHEFLCFNMLKFSSFFQGNQSVKAEHILCSLLVSRASLIILLLYHEAIHLKHGK